MVLGRGIEGVHLLGIGSEGEKLILNQTSH